MESLCPLICPTSGNVLLQKLELNSPSNVDLVIGSHVNYKKDGEVRYTENVTKRLEKRYEICWDFQGKNFFLTHCGGGAVVRALVPQAEGWMFESQPRQT